MLRTYGQRAKTRTEHVRPVAKYRGWRLPTSLDFAARLIRIYIREKTLEGQPAGMTTASWAMGSSGRMESTRIGSVRLRMATPRSARS